MILMSVSLLCSGALLPQLLSTESSAHFYRPQRSCVKVMFLHLSFCSRGGCLPHHPPWTRGRHLPGQTPLLPSACWDTHPPCPVHAGIHTPLASGCWDTHPCCAVHAGIRSTSGRYASHWNAFLGSHHFLLF